MDYRNYSWADSISSILQKTEKNFKRSPDLIENARGDRKNVSLYIPSPMVEAVYKEKRSFGFDEEEISRTSYGFQQFKVFVVEKLAAQQKEIERLWGRSERVGLIEDVREDFGQALEAVEKRCLNEIRRVESGQKTLVTFEALKSSEEYLKNDHLDHINQLELSFRTLLSRQEDLPTYIANATEENVSMLCKKYLTFEDIRKIKESFNKDNDRSIRGIKEELEEIEGKFVKFVDKVNENIIRTNLQLEKGLRGLKDELSEAREKEAKKASEFERRVEEMVRRFEGELKGVDDMKQTVALEDIEADIRILKQKVAKIPNFAEFARKVELQEVFRSVPSAEKLQTFVNRQEINKILDSRLPQAPELLKRSDLETAQNSLIHKIELLKIASAGKAEVEKLKKSLQNFSLKQDCCIATEKIKEASKSNDLLINKLVQLEQRVALLEETSESDSLGIVENNQGSGNLNSLFSEIGSKDTVSTTNQISLGKKEAKQNQLAKINSSPQALTTVESNKFLRNIPETRISPEEDFKKPKNRKEKFNIDSLISELTEGFIMNEIAFGVRKVQKSAKSVVPRLNFAIPNSESPFEMGDDLNNAVIFNTDFTNKSESPLDFSDY